MKNFLVGFAAIVVGTCLLLGLLLMAWKDNPEAKPERDAALEARIDLALENWDLRDRIEELRDLHNLDATLEELTTENHKLKARIKQLLEEN